MTSDLTRKRLDVMDYVQELFDRVAEVEQTVTGTDVQTGGTTNIFPNGVVIGGVTVTSTPPTSPTAITVTPSTNFDDIVADVSWTPAVGTTAVRYQVEVAWKSGAVYSIAQQLQTGGTQVRVVALRPNSTYGVRVYPISRLNVVGNPYPSSGFQDFVTTEDSTTPSLVTGLTLTTGMRSIVAQWTQSSDVDVIDGRGQYQVQLATDSGFVTVVKTVYVGGTIAAFADLTTGTPYWVRVKAIDETGNQGSFTAGASATPGAAGGTDIANGVLTSTHIVTAGLDAAVVKFGTMSGDRITANTLDVATLKTSTLTAKDIILGSGGQLKTASLAPGIVLNSQGLSLYNSSAVRTVFLDSATGSATFTGTVSGSTITGGTIVGSTYKSASTGQRMEIATDVVANWMRTFSPIFGGGDPYLPGRYFSDVFAASNIGRTYLRPPYATSGSGQTYLGLESGDSSLQEEGLVVFGTTNPADGTGPQFQMTRTASTFFDCGALNVFGTLAVGGGNVVRATTFQGPGGAAGQVQCFSANRLAATWDGQLHFYIDNTYIGTL